MGFRHLWSADHAPIALPRIDADELSISLGWDPGADRCAECHQIIEPESVRCDVCVSMPDEYVTEQGHLMLDERTGATVLAPHRRAA